MGDITLLGKCEPGRPPPVLGGLGIYLLKGIGRCGSSPEIIPPVFQGRALDGLPDRRTHFLGVVLVRNNEAGKMGRFVSLITWFQDPDRSSALWQVVHRCDFCP